MVEVMNEDAINSAQWEGRQAVSCLIGLLVGASQQSVIST
jgi:hypothetical protein